MTENPVQTEKMTENTVQTKEMTENIVQTKEMTENIVQTKEMTENPVQTEKMTENTVQTKEMTENIVQTKEMTENIVQTNEMTGYPVQTEKMTENTVQTKEISEDTVKTYEMKASAPRDSKLTPDMAKRKQVDDTISCNMNLNILERYTKSSRGRSSSSESNSSLASVSKVLLSTLNFLLYLAMISTDITVCYFLYTDGYHSYFWIAAGFFVFASTIQNIASLSLSVHTIHVKRSTWTSYQPRLMTVIIVAVHFLQGGMMFRYLGRIANQEIENVWVLFCPRRFYIDKKIHNGLYFDFQGLPFLLLLEAMVHCFPQLILQLCVLLKEHDGMSTVTKYVVVASLIVSLLNITRLLVHSKYYIKYKTTTTLALVLAFLGHFFMNISRIFASAFLASRYPVGFVLSAFCHFIAMSFFAFKILTKDESNSILPIRIPFVIRSLLWGVMYLLCFMRFDDGSKEKLETRYFYSFYYFIIFVENAVTTSMWFAFSDLELWLRATGLSAVLVTFMFGLTIKIVHHSMFHCDIEHQHHCKCNTFVLFPERKHHSTM